MLVPLFFSPSMQTTPKLPPSFCGKIYLWMWAIQQQRDPPISRDNNILKSEFQRSMIRLLAAHGRFQSVNSKRALLERMTIYQNRSSKLIESIPGAPRSAIHAIFGDACLPGISRPTHVTLRAFLLSPNLRIKSPVITPNGDHEKLSSWYLHLKSNVHKELNGRRRRVNHTMTKDFKEIEKSAQRCIAKRLQCRRSSQRKIRSFFFFLSSLFSTPWKRSGNARTFRDFMGSRRAERGFSVDVAACVRNKDKKCAFNWCSPSPLRQIQRERKQTTMEIKWKNERGWLHASSSWWLSCWKRIRRSQAFQLEFLLEML